MKFGGNTSYGSRMFHRKFENFSSNIAQWARFSKNLQKLVILDTVRMFFQSQFRVMVKLHEKSESGLKILKKVNFQAQIGLFVVLTTITSHAKNTNGHLKNTQK
jgi:hypothetical protein